MIMLVKLSSPIFVGEFVGSAIPMLLFVMVHMLQGADFPCSESREMRYQLEVHSLNSEQYPVESSHVHRKYCQIGHKTEVNEVNG